MQSKRILTALAAAAVFAVSAMVANADVWNKKTKLTVNETIEVPGATLPPGEYVVKLVDSNSNRHIVQFLNGEENEVLSTVIAIPNSRLEPTGKTEFEWYETPAGQPPALRAWFYPGDNFGQEFTYPEGRAATLAQQTGVQVTTTTAQQQEEIAAAQQPAPQQDDQQQREAELAQQRAQQEREAQLAQQREREAELAQQRAQQEREAQLAQQREAELAQQREQQQRDAELAQREQQEREALMAQQRQQETELPQTAGFGALLALIGLGSLGASAVVRKVRRS